MDRQLFNPAAAAQKVKGCETSVEEARAVLAAAQAKLDQAYSEQQMAVTLVEIINDVETRVSALIVEYGKAQRTKLNETLQQTMGDDPATWTNFDLSTFTPDSKQIWLSGREIVGQDRLTHLFDRLKSAAGTALPSELRGENRLRNFAHLIVSFMFVDDEWPPFVVDEVGEYIKSYSIRFEKADLR